MNERERTERDLEEGRANVDRMTGQIYETTSWTWVDLEPAKADARPPEPVYLRRQDGAALIYPGKAHAFVGDSETLKSWAAVLACASVFQSGGRAAYIDFEDSEQTFVLRARLCGIPDDALGSTVRYMHPDETSKSTRATMDLQIAVEDFRPTLVVLDGVTEAYALHGWDINSATDAARWQHLIRESVRSLGAASIEIDHTGKDLGRGAVGSQHKRAGIDGAQFEFREGSPADPGRRGWSYIHVTKDRHGAIRAIAEGKDEVGSLTVDAPGGRVWIELPEAVSGRRDALAESLLEIVRENPDIATGPIRALARRKQNDVWTALRQLEREGKLTSRKSGNATYWTVPEDGSGT